MTVSIRLRHRRGVVFQIQNGAAFRRLVDFHVHIAGIFGVRVYPEVISIGT